MSADVDFVDCVYIILFDISDLISCLNLDS